MCRGCVFIRIAGLSGVKLPAGGILTGIVCDLQKARFFMRITFRSQYGDYKIIYAFGSESLADTASNIYLAGDRVTNKELQEQFHSLSNRLLEGMPEERWPPESLQQRPGHDRGGPEDPGRELGKDEGVVAKKRLLPGSGA